MICFTFIHFTVSFIIITQAVFGRGKPNKLGDLIEHSTTMKTTGTFNKDSVCGHSLHPCFLHIWFKLARITGDPPKNM